MAEHDFLSVFNFQVALTPSEQATEEGWTAKAAFSEVGGLEIALERKELREGGYNHGQRQLVGKTSNPPLVLKRGMTHDAGFWQWIQRCFAASYPLPYIHGTIDVYEPGAAPGASRRAVRWSFAEGIAVKVRVGDLNAATGNAVPIEELHIAHEGLRREADPA